MRGPASIFSCLDAWRKIADGTGRRRQASPVAPLSLETLESYVKAGRRDAGAAAVLESALFRRHRRSHFARALGRIPSRTCTTRRRYGERGSHGFAGCTAGALDVAQSLMALKRFDGAFQELTALYVKPPAAAIRMRWRRSAAWASLAPRRRPRTCSRGQ
jgi:hypothetical protein